MSLYKMFDNAYYLTFADQVQNDAINQLLIINFVQKRTHRVQLTIVNTNDIGIFAILYILYFICCAIHGFNICIGMVKAKRWGSYFQINRIEHQKLNKTSAELSFGLVFGIHLGNR